MSLASLIHQLQSKPEATRWRIMYLLLAVIMLLFVVFWIAQVRQAFMYKERQATTSTTASPFNDVKLLFYETGESIKEGWKAFKE